MIQDQVSRLSEFAGLHPAMGQVIEFLQADSRQPAARGCYPLKYGAYVTVQCYETREAAQCRWEAHRNYWDIHVLDRGEELIAGTPVELLSRWMPYDPEKDIQFSTETGCETMVSYLNAGGFAVFFPWDAHRPCCCREKPGSVRKLVFKLPALKEGVK